MSTKYGKIEDRVAGLSVVTGRGELVRTDGPARAHRGPGWNQLVVGSEGTLGIITSARLQVSPSPEVRILRGFEVQDVASGLEAIRRVLQRGLRPAVVRLYDELDTFINHLPIFARKSAAAASEDEELLARAFRTGPVPRAERGALPEIPPREQIGPTAGGLTGRLLGLLGPSTPPARRLAGRLRRGALSAVLARPGLINGLAAPLAERLSRHGCRLIVGLEGSRIRTEIEARLVLGELERAGATDLGEEPGRHWLAHRYDVSYKMSPVFRAGLFVDTMEVAATWERLLDLHHAVKQAIAQHAVVMAHFSHAYPEGCSIYFTFFTRATDTDQALRAYDAIWRDGMAAASRVGGTISHHHGIGLLKGPAMSAEHREAMVILRALKATIDPDGIMNPGKLGLPAAPGAAANPGGDLAAAELAAAIAAEAGS
jgi:alkyldihydroxyacetonephosphate synthase